MSLCCASSAQAEMPETNEPAATEQVELDYWAVAGCPTKAQFIAEVSARIRRPVTWVVMSAGTRIGVSLSRTETEATGKLEVARDGTEVSRRDFSAGSCGEVSSALALIVALTLDPNARTDALLPAEPSAPPEPKPTPIESTPEPRPRPAPPAVAVPPPAPDVRRPRYAAWLGPVVGVDSGYAPEPLITLGLALGARLPLGGLLSPALQLTPLWGKTGSTGPSAALGTFGWSMARLEACPIDVPLTEGLGFVPCVAGELGRLAARGRAEQVEATAADRWWAAAGMTLGLRFERGLWFVRANGELLFPATRDEFVFRDPDRSVHRAEAVAYGGRLSVGIMLGR